LLVFALINRAFDPIRFVVIHRIADTDPADQIADPGVLTAEIFAYDEMEMVGEEEERVEGDRSRSEHGFVAFVHDRLRVQTFDPGEWRGVGETEVVGEEEKKILVIGVSLEKGEGVFALMADVVIVPGLEIAFE
jgi:hypothetical protein